MQNNEISNQLNDLLESFSRLNEKEQIRRIEEKIKTLILIFNAFNDNKELLLAETTDDGNGGINLVQIFNLLCCLEEEIAKTISMK